MIDEAESTRASSDMLLRRVRIESEHLEKEVLKAGRLDTDVLEKLVVLRDFEERLVKSIPKPSATPWIAFVLGTVALVALLQWLRCSQTELTAKLTVSAVDVELSGEGEVELPRKPSSVTATGFESLEVPNAEGAPTTVSPSQDTPLEVRLLPNPAAKVVLKPIHADDRNTLGMTFVEPGAVAFRVGGPSTDFQASLLHKVELRTPEYRGENDYAEAAVVLGRSSSDFGLDVTAQSWGRCVICTPVRVRTATFVEARRDSGLDAVRKLSSIRDGKLYFTAVGAEYDLRDGETLRLSFPESSVTEVVSLGVQPDEEMFELEIHGYADVVEVGSTTNPVDARPTWLEWLRSRHGPALVWATCVWVFGAFAVVRRWTRRELE
jgi:hypothetical protein